MVRNSSPEYDPIEAFFERHPSFNYGRSQDWRQLDRFEALAEHCGWRQKKRKYEERKLKQAWTQVVESEFSGSTISHYQSLCQDLNISPIPATVPECKNELREVFVNIVDLVQYRRECQMGLRAKKPRIFNSLQGLRDYSESKEKYYPRKDAKAEMLRELLKVLV
jgi:hypothetical protein